MYHIRFKKKAQKELFKLPSVMIKKLAASIDQLELDPRPDGSKKLKGSNENLWRIRIGDYRVIYLIEDVIKIVEIRKIGHRKDIYE
ncbi:type II toxin-antitoxin system RelE/ParE family toxin [Fulvivirga sp.]|uniref:type II toxin-antitoxin system RelE family toxin n=1 Tax=Fulvivirga sp. TaxID=1931237 RepID=UPI0032EE3527